MLEKQSKTGIAPLALAVASTTAAVLSPIEELSIASGGIAALSAIALWQAVNHWRKRTQVMATSLALAQHNVMVLDKEGIIENVTDGFLRNSGYTWREVEGKHFTEFLAPRHKTRQAEDIVGMLTRASHWEGDVWCCHKNGYEYPEWRRGEVIKKENGKVLGFLIVTNSTVSDRRKSHSRWSYDRIDRLTGLPNRRRIQEILGFHLPRIRSRTHDKQNIHLAILDIDHFNMINQSQGDICGDAIIETMAYRLSNNSDVDTVGRIAGDDFLVISPWTEMPHSQWCAKLRRLALEPIDHKGEHLRLSISIGSAAFPEDDNECDADMVIQHLEAALSRAKRAGGNSDRRYQEQLDNPHSKGDLGIVQDLRRLLAKPASDNSELSLNYQMLYDARSSKPNGMEALIRWVHPTLGNISPGDFIPIAENNGMVELLGQRVIEKAVEQYAKWSQATNSSNRECCIPIWVNVSAVQLFHSQLESLLASTLEHHDVPACGIGLEITESILIGEDYQDLIIEQLNRLRSAGHPIAIDDFGTGHATLSYLRKMPANKVKIDRAFVDGVPEDTVNAAIVRSVVNIAKEINIDVVAEGVETQAQMEWLTREGCSTLQGYFLARPLPASSIDTDMLLCDTNQRQ